MFSHLFSAPEPESNSEPEDNNAASSEPEGSNNAASEPEDNNAASSEGETDSYPSKTEPKSENKAAGGTSYSIRCLLGSMAAAALLMSWPV